MLGAMDTSLHFLRTDSSLTHTWKAGVKMMWKESLKVNKFTKVVTKRLIKMEGKQSLKG